MQDNICAATCLFYVFDGVGGTSITNPTDGLRIFFMGKGDDFYFFGNHKGRVESQSKVTNDLRILVFAHKLLST